MQDQRSISYVMLVFLKFYFLKNKHEFKGATSGSLSGAEMVERERRKNVKRVR